MRHRKAHRKLGRDSEHRISMLRNLATSLINARDERIVTTLPKAKELRPFIERAITLSRHAANLEEGNGSEARGVHLRRQAASYFHAGNFGRGSVTGRRGQPVPARTAGAWRKSTLEFSMSAGVKRAMNDQESQQPAAEQSSEPRPERHRERGRRGHRALPKHLEASINMEELRELIGLITDNALTDFELQREGFHVKVGRNLYPDQQ